MPPPAARRPPAAPVPWIVLDPDASCVIGHERAGQRLSLGGGSKQAVGFEGVNVDKANEFLRRLRPEALLAKAPNPSSLTVGRKAPITFILTVDKNLIVFVSNLSVVLTYLIYDALKDSFTLIPSCPSRTKPTHTNQVLIARRWPSSEADPSSYSLVLMYQREELCEDGHSSYWKNLLFMWPSSSSSPWELTKTAIYPDHLKSDDCTFFADQAFQFCGCAYWADLLRGIIFCNSEDMFDDSLDEVEFDYFPLTPKCQRANLRNSELVAEPIAYRTIGSVGNFIKFVCIEGFSDALPHCRHKVTVWRLLNSMQWKLESQIYLDKLWLQNPILPMHMTLMYPILSKLEAHVVYFLLGDYEMEYGCIIPKTAHYVLRVDMSNKKLLSAVPLPDHWFAGTPAHLGADFPTYLSAQLTNQMATLQLV